MRLRVAARIYLKQLVLGYEGVQWNSRVWRGIRENEGEDTMASLRYVELSDPVPGGRVGREVPAGRLPSASTLEV